MIDNDRFAWTDWSQLKPVSRARKKRVSRGTTASDVPPRTLAARRQETAVHAAADAHARQFYTAARLAFVAGRRAVDKPALRLALANRDPKRVAVLLEGVPGAVRTSLSRTLAPITRATLKAGGEAGATILLKQLRTAGGPGSGNFGHEGRPGVVGGSGDSTGVTPVDGQRYFVRIGELPAKGYSSNFATGQIENGVSVYDAVGHEGKFQIETPPEGEWASEDLHSRLDNVKQEKEIAYLVKGNYSGEGGDGEPLLQDVVVVAKIDPSLMVVRSLGMRTAGGVGSGNFGHAGRPGEVGGSAGQTGTAAFKTWFADSKVVDEHGEPLRAYHGTTKDFQQFNTDIKPSGPGGRNRNNWTGDMGSWFTAPSKYTGNYDEENAEAQAGFFTEGRLSDGSYGMRPGARVIPVYLSVKNPIEFEGWEDFDDERGDRSGASFRQALIAKGHDGAVIRNSMTDGDVDRADWIAFRPEQVKSAIGNRGTFDPTSKLITMGGPGSGNFGHAGRPGEIGGSGSRTVYHGTQEAALASIKAHGLSPYTGVGTGADEYARQQGADMGGRPASVYVTDSQIAAEQYARYAAEVNDDTQPILLKIEVPKEFWDAHVRTEDQGDAFAFKTNIPPEWITGVAVVEPSIWAIPQWKVLAASGSHVVYSVVLVKKTLKTAGGADTHEAFRTAKKPAPTLQMRFDVTNEKVVEWAKKHVGESIDEITETTRKNIAAAVARAAEEGDLDQQYEEILDAIGNDSRAELIAKTESMTAAGNGQRQSWYQAEDHGLLPEDAVREWIATDDPTVCALCLGLDGKTATLHGQYPEPGGDGPILHMRCRCSEGIVG